MPYENRWAEENELADYVPSLDPSHRLPSSRVLVAKSVETQELTLLKLVVNASVKLDRHRSALIESSLLRAAAIRSTHISLTNYIEHRWTRHGLVVVSEYLGDAAQLRKARTPDVERLVQIWVGLVDGVAHIHQQRSAHGDITSANIVLNSLNQGFLVDYDLAEPIKDVSHSRYDGALTAAKLEKRQCADAAQLRNVVIASLRRAQRYSISPAITSTVIRHIRKSGSEHTSNEKISRLQEALQFLAT
jgi:tRNA A-37 threonylcarbamoyl transferase component Bud32